MNNYKRHCSWTIWLASFVLGFFLTANLVAQNAISSGDTIIMAVRSCNIDAFDKTAETFQIQNEKLVSELLFILADVNSSNVQRCSAAYFLGEMHAARAAEALATNITLCLTHPIDHLTILMKPPAVEALVKISTPSIPFVLQNLENIDDSNVRKLSLQVLYRIDGDKDVVQLRLQNALSAESDPQKQGRLQSALKTLEDTSFVN